MVLVILAGIGVLVLVVQAGTGVLALVQVLVVVLVLVILAGTGAGILVQVLVVVLVYWCSNWCGYWWYTDTDAGIYWCRCTDGGTGTGAGTGASTGGGTCTCTGAGAGAGMLECWYRYLPVASAMFCSASAIGICGGPVSSGASAAAGRAKRGQLAISRRAGAWET